MASVHIENVNSDSHLFSESDSHSSSYADVLPTQSRYPDLSGKRGIFCCCPHCRRVLKEYKSLRRANYALGFLCVLAVLVYIGTIVHFWTRFPSGGVDNDNVRAEKQQSEHVYTYCVQRETMELFRNSWTDMEYIKTRDKYCFKTLDWVPTILSQVYEDLDKRVKTAEESIQNIGARGHEATVKNGSSGNQGQDTVGYRPRPFAHVTWDSRHDYKAGETAVKWSASGMTGSYMRDMYLKGTDLIIKHSGYYFIYSHLEFIRNEQAEQPRLQVYLNYRDRSVERGRRKLMESPGPAPFVQGVFLLHEDEVISVHTDVNKVFGDTGRSNYLGIFLL